MAGKEKKPKAKYPNQKNQDGRQVPRIPIERKRELDKDMIGKGKRPIPGSQRWADELKEKKKRGEK